MEERPRTQRTSWDFEKAARILAAKQAESNTGAEGEKKPTTDGEPTPAENEETDAEAMPLPPALTPRYMSAQTWRDMERAAAKGMMPQPGMCAGDRMLYFTLLGLYAAHQNGLLPAGIAKVEKRLAVDTYNSFVDDKLLYMTAGKFYKEVEAACTAFAKCESYENARGMYLAVHKSAANARMRARTDYENGGNGDA